jgi:hypothetical protein
MTSGKILATCIPKSGTHLLTSVLSAVFAEEAVTVPKRKLSQLTIREVMEAGTAKVFAGHYPWNPRFAPPPDSTVIVLVRDPRDILLSMHEYLTAPRAMSKEHKKLNDYLQGKAYELQLLSVLNGIALEGKMALRPLWELCGGYMEWTEHGAALVRYEDFFSEEAAAKLARILEPFGIESSRIEEAIKSSVGVPTKTLNRGEMNRWERELPASIVEQVRKYSNGIVEQLGYRWDMVPA